MPIELDLIDPLFSLGERLDDFGGHWGMNVGLSSKFCREPKQPLGDWCTCHIGGTALYQHSLLDPLQRRTEIRSCTANVASGHHPQHQTHHFVLRERIDKTK